MLCKIFVKLKTQWWTLFLCVQLYRKLQQTPNITSKYYLLIPSRTPGNAVNANNFCNRELVSLSPSCEWLKADLDSYIWYSPSTQTFTDRQNRQIWNSQVLIHFNTKWNKISLDLRMSQTLILVTMRSTFSSCVVIGVIVKRQFISSSVAANQDCPDRDAIHCWLLVWRYDTHRPKQQQQQQRYIIERFPGINWFTDESGSILLGSKTQNLSIKIKL